jgi:cell division protein ZapE
MLMDMFFDHVTGTSKRRTHFHDFMQDVHERIHAQRQLLKQGKTKETDPVLPVARALATEAKLLCFDEFSVTDVADAMILSRLFTKMLDLGVTVVATSNVAPDALYPDGLNRKFFMSFIELLKQNVGIFWLDARIDFRLEKLARSEIYILKSDNSARKSLDHTWQSLTGTILGGREVLKIKGRELVVPQAKGGAARFSFNELCENPLAAGDYLALAARYHTLFIDDIPQMKRENRNEAKRFIILIDALYDNHVNLLCTAAAPPDKLYTATSGTEHFEFQRTASRLIEMQSHEYLEQSQYIQIVGGEA